MYQSDKKPLELTPLDTLADDDVVIVGHTSDTNEVVKSFTWANLKAVLKTYFDTLYPAIADVPSALTVETPTGTVDGSNATFTVSEVPLWIISDGIMYFDGAGYSIAALTVTMTVPPSSFIRAVIQ